MTCSEIHYFGLLALVCGIAVTAIDPTALKSIHYRKMVIPSSLEAHLSKSTTIANTGLAYCGSVCLSSQCHAYAFNTMEKTCSLIEGGVPWIPDEVLTLLTEKSKLFVPESTFTSLTTAGPHIFYITPTKVFEMKMGVDSSDLGVMTLISSEHPVPTSNVEFCTFSWYKSGVLATGCWDTQAASPSIKGLFWTPGLPEWIEFDISRESNEYDITEQKKGKGVLVDDEVFFFGGIDSFGQETDQCQKLDLATGIQVPCKPLPLAVQEIYPIRLSPASSKVLLIGGISSTAYLESTYEFDTVNEIYSQVGDVTKSDPHSFGCSQKETPAGSGSYDIVCFFSVDYDNIERLWHSSYSPGTQTWLPIGSVHRATGKEKAFVFTHPGANSYHFVYGGVGDRASITLYEGVYRSNTWDDTHDTVPAAVGSVLNQESHALLLGEFGVLGA